VVVAESNIQHGVGTVGMQQPAFDAVVTETEHHCDPTASGPSDGEGRRIAKDSEGYERGTTHA
jgi:hypothetical protein